MSNEATDTAEVDAPLETPNGTVLDVPDEAPVSDQDADTVDRDVEAAVEPGGEADVEPDVEADGEEDVESGASRPSKTERLEHEGDIAADYLEELLDIADLDGDLDMDVEGDRAAVSIVGADLAQLVGPRGEVLDALQELTRLAVYRETGERSRLMLDIGGHRAELREALVVQAEEAIAKVKAAGEPVSFDPMSPFERKVVHDVVAAAGLVSESEGVEPRRYVVVQPS